LRGAKLEHRSIQIGIGRELIKDFATQWIADIQDFTPLTRKIHTLCRKGHHDKAKKLLPPERVYPLPKDLARTIGIL